jgi:hypothetical protein
MGPVGRPSCGNTAEASEFLGIPNWLVVWNMAFIFPIFFHNIWDVILPK